MKKYILPILLSIFSTTTFVYADYDSRKYIPEWVPYNYDDAVEFSDFDDCKEPLDKFDDAYFLLEWKVIPGSDEGTIFYRYEESDPSGITSLKQLKERVESEIRDCIADYPDYIAKKESEQAEKLAELQAQEEAEERVRMITVALDRCDFDFFERMSTDEKMDTYDERKACEEVLNQPEPKPIEPAVISAPVPEPITQEPVAPSYIPPTPTKPVAEQVTPEPMVVPEVIQDEVATSAEATTSSEIIEITEEELNRLVEERVAERASVEKSPAPEPVPEEKPSLFRRITNFLFGWMF
jgi:hypothetical protein